MRATASRRVKPRGGAGTNSNIGGNAMSTGEGAGGTGDAHDTMRQEDTPNLRTDSTGTASTGTAGIVPDARHRHDEAKGNGPSHAGADTNQSDGAGPRGGGDDTNQSDGLDGTPFGLAKREMWAKLILFRDGHKDWDADSVMAHVAVVAANHRSGRIKVSKKLLESWTATQLKVLKPLRDMTTRPIPETGHHLGQQAGEQGGRDDDPLAAFGRATMEMRAFIERYEAGDLARQAVLAAVPGIATRHRVDARDLRSWTADELKKLEVSPDKPAPTSREEPDPAAVPDDPDDLARQREAAWALCHAVARDPMRMLLDIARRLGIVGDRGGVIAVFLTMVSRLLAEPASLLRKGASSSGKSFPIDGLRTLFNKDIDYIEFTAASAKALPYDRRNYRNRAVLIGEATALVPGKHGDEAFVGMVREMLSKGRIVYTTVIKTGGKNAELVSVTIEKAGPIALITTAAREIVEEEMNTRLLSSLADETPRQTQVVTQARGQRLKGTAPPRPGEDELAHWRAFQDSLRLGPREVVVPYADVLSALIDTKSLRVRRDFGAVGALIQASALVHRTQRQVDAQGRVIAELRDYEWVLAALDTGLDELRFGNVDQLNHVRQVVADALDRRRLDWWRGQTLDQAVAKLAEHCIRARNRNLAQRLRDAGTKAAGEAHGCFARFRDIMTNNGQDPTFGGIAATQAASEQLVGRTLLAAGRQVRADMAKPNVHGNWRPGGHAPREVELSYAKLAELLGVTYKVARTRLTMAAEAGAVIEWEPHGRPRNAPHHLAPGKVVIATRSGRGRGAFPSLVELQEKLAEL
jgi:hypothetical protein